MALRIPRSQSSTILRLLDHQVARRMNSPVRARMLSEPYHTLLQRPFSSGRLSHQQQQEAASQTLGKVEPKLAMTFTCTVTDCGHISTHEFTRRSYERGIVIVQCPGCNNRHLIADHLSWFTENASDPKTIEQMIEAQGGKVKRGMRYEDGKGYETVEMFEDTEEPNKAA